MGFVGVRCEGCGGCGEVRWRDKIVERELLRGMRVGGLWSFVCVYVLKDVW